MNHRIPCSEGCFHGWIANNVRCPACGGSGWEPMAVSESQKKEAHHANSPGNARTAEHTGVRGNDRHHNTRYVQPAPPPFERGET